KRHLDRLTALRRLDDPHRHRLPLVKPRKAGGAEHRAMDENVPAEVVAGDEAEASDAVEPLDPARESDCGRDVAVCAPVDARARGARSAGGAGFVNVHDPHHLHPPRPFVDDDADLRARRRGFASERTERFQMQECVSLAAGQCDETIAFVASEPFDDSFPRGAVRSRTVDGRMLLASLAVAGGKSIATHSKRRLELPIPIHLRSSPYIPSAPNHAQASRRQAPSRSTTPRGADQQVQVYGNLVSSTVTGVTLRTRTSSQANVLADEDVWNGRGDRGEPALRSDHDRSASSGPIRVQKHADEFGKAARLGLFHDVGAVNFDGPRADSHFVGNDLVGLPLDQPV